jgi:hypothetical protein
MFILSFTPSLSPQLFKTFPMTYDFSRAVRYLGYIHTALSLPNPIDVEIISAATNLNATLVLDQGFYDSSRIAVSFSDSNDDVIFHIGSYPVTEFQSILSIICRLLPRFRYFADNPTLLTRAIAYDATQELRLCEEILTVRTCLTNAEYCPDWVGAFDDPPPKNVFVSLFPFRDSIYVTVYRVSETTEPLCQLRDGSSPFHFLPKSVVEIMGQRYAIVDSIVAKQSQQFLGQTIRWLRLLTEILDALAALKPRKVSQAEAEEEAGKVEAV